VLDLLKRQQGLGQIYADDGEPPSRISPPLLAIAAHRASSGQAEEPMA